MPAITEDTFVGSIFDIQRMSINDGPGIRTTVFLKGCPLECLWCHNPEGRAGRPHLAFTPRLCIGCGYCFRRCPNEAHVMEGEEHRINRERCSECFACVEECYANALEVIGREETVSNVLKEVMKDKPFYDESGGGMTLSGGEPLAQPEFTKRLLAGARERGLHTCLETSGFGNQRDLLGLVPLVDLFLYDCKETDPARHKEYTGRDNAPILDNLRALDAEGAAIILRCPIVPGLNLREEHLAGIVTLVKSLAHCEAIHIMGHHALGEGKRVRIGEPSDDRPGYPNMTREEIQDVVQRVRDLGGENVAQG